LAVAGWLLLADGRAVSGLDLDHVVTLHRKAKAFLADGDYEGALESAREMEASAHKAQILARVAQVRVSQGRTEESKELLSEAVTMASIAPQLKYEDVEAFFEIGVAYLKMEDLGRAAKSFEEAMDRDEEMADFPVSQRLFSVALLRDYDFFIAARVALAYVEAGDFEEALRLCRERQMDIYGKGSTAATAIVLTKIALGYMALNDPAQARQAIDEALAMAETVSNESLRGSLRDDILLIRDTQINPT